MSYITNKFTWGILLPKGNGRNKLICLKKRKKKISISEFIFGNREMRVKINEFNVD